MSAILKIEIVAASHIERACSDACRIAELLGIGVEFDFNGVRCLALPFTPTPSLLANNQRTEQNKELASPLERRFASTGSWNPLPPPQETTP